MSSRECYLSSLRKSEPKNMNIILLDTEMADAPEEGITPEQRGYINMIDAPENGVIEVDLDPRVPP